MSKPMVYDFQRFLAAKKGLDDRSLNRPVLERLTVGLEAGDLEGLLSVLEIGAGIGMMVERLIAWGVLKRARYEAIDLDPENIVEARRRIYAWSHALGLDVAEESEGFRLLAKDGTRDVAVHFEAADVYEFSGCEPRGPRYDLLIAHAFLDLVDIDRLISALLPLLRQGGLLYLTATFDGLTALLPTLDAALDESIIACYHQSMDARRVDGLPSGGSRSGRHLFSLLPRRGVEILCAGASDWVVHPERGRYRDDEAYFLHSVVHMIHMSLACHPGLPPGPFDEWIAERHAQIDRGELSFIAHQLDFLGRLT